MTDGDDLQARQGYLLLADISGYTAFLTGTELEHAHAIVRELTKLIRERLAPPMRFVKLEGDAVFCYAEAGTFADGERFAELIEVCYFDFSNRLQDMTRGTTCRCDACAAIPSLGLKFVTHFGTFMIERDDGREDLAGPDVILVHRLLKNTISDDGGPKAYAFFTEACLQRLPASFALPEHSAEYDSFGEITGGVHDLEPVAEEMRDARREYIDPGSADVDANMELPFPPSVVWQYFVEPGKRLRWQTMQTAITNRPNERGRQGTGSTSHCEHGDAGDGLREYLDWQPYRYFTCRFTPLEGYGGAPLMLETTEFAPLEDGGTRVSYRIRAEDRGEATMREMETKAAIIKQGFPLALGPVLQKAIEEDVAALAPDATGDPEDND
ncbi:MAG TPA: DUF2652 domain-containing protein [Dehalococcoidia bacterium]